MAASAVGLLVWPKRPSCSHREKGPVMRTDGTDPYLEWTAAYVLGSLDPDERREFENHQIECSTCAAAVKEFVALPALLSTLPDDEALTLGRAGPPPTPRELLRIFVDKVRRRRRRPTD